MNMDYGKEKYKKKQESLFTKKCTSVYGKNINKGTPL